LLEVKLAQAGLTIYGLNSGVLGWGTLQEKQFAQDHFVAWNPDVLVLTFCGNDPSDDSAFLQRRPIPLPGKAFLRQHSQLYVYVFNQYQSLLIRRESREQRAPHDGRNQLAVDDPEIEPQSGRVITDLEWQRSLQEIAELFRMFIAYNPNGLMILQSTAPWETNMADHLRTITNGKNFIFLDLFDDAQKLPQADRRLFFDEHWSAKVHTLVAEKLFEVLRPRYEVQR
jgi:hypothetical protein